MKLLQLLLPFFFTITCVCQAQLQPKPLKPVTAAQWQEDIDYFAKQLVKKHANIFHFTTKEKFDQAIKDLKRDLPSLKDYQVVVRLLGITSSIGDGHTVVHLPSGFTHYPVVFFWFGKELYATRTTREYAHVAGKKLVKIDGHNLEEINTRLQSVITTNENEWFVASVRGQMMGVPEILHTLGIVSDLAKAKFTFTDEDNNQTEVEMNAFVPDGKHQWVSAVKNEPLFRQRTNETFWFTYLPDLNAVYVNFKNYNELAHNTGELFELFDQKKATRMIIDLRQNGGGDFTKVRRQFIPKIHDRSELNQKGNLFVVTGRQTFSAAMVSAIDFKKETNAIIIGEPPGEKPNSYSENDEMTLPHSGLVVSYSTRYYKFLEKDIPYFDPDVRVDPNWKDFVAGTDPVMEKIKAIVLHK